MVPGARIREVSFLEAMLTIHRACMIKPDISEAW
jgi:hypothetical protein